MLRANEIRAGMSW